MDSELFCRQFCTSSRQRHLQSLYVAPQVHAHLLKFFMDATRHIAQGTLPAYLLDDRQGTIESRDLVLCPGPSVTRNPIPCAYVIGSSYPVLYIGDP